MSDWLKVGIIILVIVLIVGVVYAWINTTDDLEAVIAGQSAFYEVPVEDYQPRKTGGWDETVPKDAYDMTSQRKQRGSHQQWMGQTCSGSGSKRTCTNNYITIPDYDTWVDYTVDRWQVIRIATAAYQSEKDDLKCPNPDVKEDAVVKHGSQRALPCVKHYSVRVVAAEKPYTCPVNSDIWFAMDIGTKWSMKVGKFTGTPWCDTLGDDK
jgi:hypothetical protein